MQSMGYGARRRGLTVASAKGCGVAAFALVAALLVLASPSVAGASGWSKPVRYSAIEDGVSVSCATESFCMAVGFELPDAVIYRAGTWSAPVEPEKGNPLTSVSCPSEEFCVALTPTGGVIYEKGSWGKPFVIDNRANGNDLRSVSCISSSFCFAVGVQGKVFTYNGTGWTGPVHVAQERELNSVSCFSTSFCVTGGQEGYVAVYNGSSWSSPSTSVDPGQFIASVSCGAPAFCAAGDNSGGVLTYSRGAWSSRLHLPGLVLSYNVQVSCHSESFCAGVSADGRGWTFNGSSWSTPVIVDPNVPLALSCPSTTFCLAADISGKYLTYSGEASSTPPPPPVLKCRVPKLRGKTLTQARKLLTKSHCKLGKVTQSRRHAKHRLVISERPGAGKTLPSGTKIAVKVR